MEEKSEEKKVQTQQTSDWFRLTHNAKDRRTKTFIRVRVKVGGPSPGSSRPGSEAAFFWTGLIESASEKLPVIKQTSSVCFDC